MSWYYEKTTPREVKGGIKSQSRTGAFASTWWAQRWIEVLEDFDIGARLSRGRTYARKGQVISININEGSIEAKVQGSRVRPYSVTIKVKTLTEEQWKMVIESLSEQAIYAAKLMSGEMPDDIEDIFYNAELSLFPERETDLDTDCSCPDWSNPCKHIAAVYYLLGEEFDRDPFLIFKLRGMDKKKLLDNLRGSIEVESEDTSLPDQQITASTFWKSESDFSNFIYDARKPKMDATLIRRLGSIPFWQGSQSLLDSTTQIYKDASDIGFKLATIDQINDSEI